MFRYVSSKRAGAPNLRPETRSRSNQMVQHRYLRRAAVGLSAVLGLAVASIAPASADNGVDSSALRNAVTVPGILAHEQALQKIANQNGGTRAAGTPGYE